MVAAGELCCLSDNSGYKEWKSVRLELLTSIKTDRDEKDTITDNEIQTSEIEQTLDTGCQTNKDYFVSAESLNDEEKSFLENIICLLPMAIQYLSEHNQLQVWVLLFKCLANRTLPLHDMSY